VSTQITATITGETTGYSHSHANAQMTSTRQHAGGKDGVVGQALRTFKSPPGAVGKQSGQS
jgi:hypothetical protein